MSTLDHAMAAQLLRLEMLSHGSTQAWNASGGKGGEPDDKALVMVLRGDTPPHITYRSLYGRQTTDAGRARIIEEAKAEVASWTHRTMPRDTKHEKPFSQVVIEDGKGWAAEVVAQHFGVAVAFIHRIRVEAKRDPETGEVPVRDRLAERAREMRARGVTTRKIAVTLQVHQTQVMRWIRAAA